MRSSLLLFSSCLALVGVFGCDGESGVPVGSGEAMATAACTNLAAGPFQPVSLGKPFSGSEDFTLDGQGNMVGKRGNAIVRVGREGVATPFATLPGQTFGLRFRPSGALVGAMPGEGRLVSVSPAGEVTNLLTGLGSPNGVFVDLEDNVWFTDFGGSKVGQITPSGEVKTIASGPATAQSANGVVVDGAKRRLFYTEFGKGKVHRVDLDTPGASPVEVARIPGARLDGLVLDACGNVYVVDQGNARLFRVRIAESGAAAAEPELLATFPESVANAQFGNGNGLDDKTLFVVGNPGAVFAVPVGVTGAPVPTGK